MSERATPSGGRVLLLQRRLTHYRVPFFEALRSALRRRGSFFGYGRFSFRPVHIFLVV